MAHPTSWVPGASDPDGDFPLQNLPLCVFRPAGEEAPRIGVGIGEAVLDLRAWARDFDSPSLPPALLQACQAPALNDLLAMGRPAMARLRQELQAQLIEHAPHAARTARLLHPRARVALGLPVAVGEYTDFLSSYHHALNVGRLFRPDQPVLPNFSSLPVAYHGRASSIVASGEPVYRPHGQFRAGGHGQADAAVVFGPTRRLDLEVELGAVIGTGNARGHPIPVDRAAGHVAGLCLLNDWSARDIQAWESQPLGPFQGKNFASTLSPWLVTLEALEPYRVAPAPRRPGLPELAAYLRTTAHGAYPIRVKARLSTERMRREGLPEATISRAMFSRDSDWTFSQMVAHHTINGCNLRPGDLLGSGTLSGPEPGTEGSLVELTRGGAAPLQLPNGETRAFLEDGDEVVLTAFCTAPGLPRIGFGECRGRIEPAPSH